MSARLLQRSAMPWADRDRRDGPQEGFVDSLASSSPAFIAGWAPSTSAAKRTRATEYAHEWQQRKTERPDRNLSPAHRLGSRSRGPATLRRQGRRGYLQ